MAQKAVQIIGVPSDLGANMRGANMGPAAIRIAELHHKISVLGYDILDTGDIDVPIRDTLSAESAQQKYLSQIQRVCELLETSVHDALKAGRMPIVLGGDHSIAMGTITGTSRYHRSKGQAVGL